MKLLIELRESEYIGILTRVATIGSDVSAADVIIANGTPITEEPKRELSNRDIIGALFPDMKFQTDKETCEFLDKKFNLGGTRT